MHYKKLTALSLLAASAVLPGCANLYEPPTQTEPTSKIAVKNTRTGPATWTHSKIQMIDGKLAGLQVFPSSSARLHPGRHTFTIITQFNNGIFSGGPFESFSDVSADLKANQSYVVNASLNGSKILTWISDNAGHKVSSVVSNTYHTMPMPVHTYVYTK